MMTYIDLLLKTVSLIWALVCVNVEIYTETSNISTIPKQATEGDPVFHIQDNRISRITKDAFITYSNLRKLVLINLGLQYIEEGAFNGQDNMEKFVSISNWNVHFPSDLGPPTKSLTWITLWQTLPPHADITFPYFAAFGNLADLNIGGSRLKTFRPDLLPQNLLHMQLAYVRLPFLPALALYAPLLQDVHMKHCQMQSMPFENVIGVNEVKALYLPLNKLTKLPAISFMDKLNILKLQNNRLSSTPDLYDMPFTRPTLASNPMVCDKALCWIRMWPSMKTASIPSDEPVCAEQAEVAGMKLMDVDPTFMECFRGE